MFDFSFSELLVVAVVALIVIGPQRLPKVARTAGHLLGRLQRYVADVKSDINREIELEELRRLRAEMDAAARSVEATARSLEVSARQHMGEIQEAFDDVKHEAAQPLSSSGNADVPAVAGDETPGAALQQPRADHPATAVPPTQSQPGSHAASAGSADLQIAASGKSSTS